MSSQQKARRTTASGLRERIEQEIEVHKQAGLGRKGWPYLNNFPSRLPGGLHRRVFEEVDLDAAYSDARSSRKLRGMTPRKFFALIDELIAELGLDTGKIVRLQNTPTLEIHEYVFPLYVRLREEGFKHYPDLTA